MQEEEYPSQAVQRGTIVRSNRIDRLGAVLDASKDPETGEVYYTCFFIPNTAPGLYRRNIAMNSPDVSLDEIQGVIMEESEYDLTYYFMVGPINLEELDIYQVPGEYML